MHKTAEITRLIHENLSIVLTFAYSRPAIGGALQRRFRGEWKYLHMTIYEIGEKRADRALLEMATQLRVIDDTEDLGSHYPHPFGKVVQGDGSETPLYFRDMTNKVIHGAEFQWQLRSADDPYVVITSARPERWQRAQLEMESLMAFIGLLVL